MQGARTEQTGGDVVAQALCLGFSGRHTPALAAGLGDDSVLHVSGRSGLAGDFQGRESILELLRTMAAETQGTLRCLPIGSATTRDGATTLRGRATATRGSRRLDVEVEFIVTLSNDMLREAWIEWVGQADVDAFWI